MPIRRLTNEDDLHHHHWVNRGIEVCPYQCCRCGALSGTNDAGEECAGVPTHCLGGFNEAGQFWTNHTGTIIQHRAVNADL